jgi:hyperosmotically inducible protein
MTLSHFFKITLAASLLFCGPLSFAGTLTPADADITQAIYSKIKKENALSDSKVDITSHDGVVTLTGEVDTNNQAEKIIQIAGSVKNVKDVETQDLKIKNGKYNLQDLAITAKVKGMFEREKLFGNKDISSTNLSVKTTNGTVYLTGTVKTKKQATNAVKYAKTVVGVKKVESTLEVKPTE